jgi:hypothetical protein
MKKFSYLIVLQQFPPISNPAEKPLELYRNFIPETIQNVAAEFQRTKADVIQKNGTILRGGLSHFLSTPLKSDKDEIIQLIEDSIENTVQQLDAAPVLASVEHSLWRVMEPQEVPLQRQMVGVVKRLLKNGRTFLVDAGCTFGKNMGDIAVSLFSFDGFSTVQSLKLIVDRFPREKQFALINGSFNAALISIDQETTTEKNLVVIDFDFHDDTVIELLNQRLPVLLDQFGIKKFSLSKQALHSVAGSTFQIRFGMNVNTVPLGSVILSLIGENAELENAITNDGSVIVLEQLP